MILHLDQPGSKGCPVPPSLPLQYSHNCGKKSSQSGVTTVTWYGTPTIPSALVEDLAFSVTDEVSKNIEPLFSRAISDQPAVEQLEANASPSLPEQPVENAHSARQTSNLDPAVQAARKTVNYSLRSQHHTAMPSQLFQSVALALGCRIPTKVKIKILNNEFIYLVHCG